VAVVGGNVEGLGGAIDAILDELAHVPKVLYLHDVPAGALATRPVDRVLAASRFIADVAPAGADVEVLPPIVDRRDYSVPTTRRTALFVNPVEQKGLSTALWLAERHPEVPFAFARCWFIAEHRLASLRAEVRRLGNVVLRDSVTDPPALYGDARVLLVPSTEPEGFGRVAREAQCSGIPVIATRAGGLPQAVGRGGVLVDPDAGVERWSAALSRVWRDRREYERLSVLALRQAADSECAAERVGARLEAILEEVSAGAARLAA
jgi:glycosyltransferase involved in cell wall biosynthesis